MIDEERAGLPSASKLEQMVNCPGCKALEDSIPIAMRQEIVDVKDEQAERGVRIHKARETSNTLGLSTEEEVETYKRGLKFEQELLNAWKDQYSIHRQDCFLEQRLWLHDDDLNAIASGRLDVLYVALPYALIVDWKSWFCNSLSPSVRNFQLRLQAVLVAQEYGATNIRVAFCKPKLKWGASDYCDYTEKDLKYAEQQIGFYLWMSQQADAPRHPGHWCHYCAAKAICPEAGALSMLPSVIATRNSLVERIEDKETAALAVADLGPGDLLKIWEISKPAEWIADAVSKRLKAMPENELAQLGLELAPGKQLDPITKVRELVKHLTEELHWDEAKVWACLTMEKGPLADLARQEKGLSSDRASKQFIASEFSDYITPKRSEGWLRRIKQ